MTINEAREIVYAQMLTNWTPPTSTPPIVMGNEDYDSTGVGEWVRFTMQHAGGGQESHGSPGNRKFIRRGLVLVQMYVAADQGLQRLDALAKTTLDLFEAARFSGVILFDGDYRELAPDDGYLRGTVAVALWYEEQK